MQPPPSKARTECRHALATDSEGEVWENPKAYYQAERKLARWQRAQTRRTKQSRGWWEAQRKIDRLQRHTNGLRRNAVHQMTGTLVRKFKNLVIDKRFRYYKKGAVT